MLEYCGISLPPSSLRQGLEGLQRTTYSIPNPAHSTARWGGGGGLGPKSRDLRRRYGLSGVSQ